MSDIVIQNPLDILKSLMDNSNIQQQNNLAGQDQTQQTQNAYQKGVNKALSEQGYKHGAEALQAGVDPNSIATHNVMQPPTTPAGDIRPLNINGNNQSISDPLQLLSSLVAKNLSSQEQVNQIKTKDNNQDKNTNNWEYKPDNPVSSFFNMLGFRPTPENQVLLTQAAMNRQKIASGQPAEIALPLAQTANQNALGEYQRLTNSGQKPIDPEQYMSAYSQMYQKAYEAHASVAKTGGDIAKTSQDLMKSTADQTRNAVEKAMGSQSKESQATLESAIAAQKAALDATSNFTRFMTNNSPVSVINSIKQKVSNNSVVQKQSGLVKPGQTITINGKTIKRLN